MRLTCSLTVLAMAGTIGAAALPSAHAAILAQESFNYTPGANLVGQIPGTGFSGSWFVGQVGTDDAVTINADHTATFTGTGQVELNLDTSAGGPFQDYLNATGNVGKDGTSLFLSFSWQTVDHNAWQAFDIHRDGTDDAARVWYAGEIGLNAVTFIGPNEGNWSSLASDVGDRVRVAVEIDFNSATGNLVTGYSVAPDGTASQQFQNAYGTDFSFDNISLYSPGATGLTVGDIRIGSALADVTAVPEPATGLLLALAAAPLLARRRRA